MLKYPNEVCELNCWFSKIRIWDTGRMTIFSIVFYEIDCALFTVFNGVIEDAF